MMVDHPVELWTNPEFMEEVRQIVSVKWPHSPEHCPNLCGYMAKAHEIATEHILLHGADPHETTFLTFAHLFALGYEAALLDLAQRKHET